MSHKVAKTFLALVGTAFIACGLKLSMLQYSKGFNLEFFTGMFCAGAGVSYLLVVLTVKGQR